MKQDQILIGLKIDPSLNKLLDRGHLAYCKRINKVISKQEFIRQVLQKECLHELGETSQKSTGEKENELPIV